VREATFWRVVVSDEVNLLDEFVGATERQGVSYCLIGGQAVNAYVDPLVSLDLDVVVAAGALEPLLRGLPGSMQVERFPPSVNVSQPGSDLRIQIQTDARYIAFVERAQSREVLGHTLRVARVEDVLRGKVWAFQDSQRRPSKRQKDLADISRLVESFADLRANVPPDVLARLM
jgi:hypothetical protein